MSELIITNDTEFYGLLNNVDIISAAKIAELLRMPAICEIHEDGKNIDEQKRRTSQAVVHEIIRRDGIFYTGLEASLEATHLASWNMSADVCVARIGWLDGEIKPINPAYAEYDWVILNLAQYMYGKYLQAKIEKGELTISNLSN